MNLDDEFLHGTPELNKQDAFLRELGVPLNEILSLKKILLSDFDDKFFGVRWFEVNGKNEKKLSILATDYSFQLIEGVVEALSETLVHLNELKVLWKADQNRFADTATLRTAGPHVLVKNRRVKRDFYLEELERCHVVGVLRGIGSVIDLLTAVFVYCGGLPIDLFNCNYMNLKQEQDRIESEDALSAFRSRVQAKFNNLIKLEAPAEWVPWVMKQRSAFVHKGRRTIFNIGLQKDTGIQSLSGGKCYSFSLGKYVPKNPDLSEIEAYLAVASRETDLVGEDLQEVLKESANICVNLVRKVFPFCELVWNERKLSPHVEFRSFDTRQWPKIKKPKIRIEGFGARRGRINPKEIMVSPEVTLRMSAAGILDDKRDFWMDP